MGFRYRKSVTFGAFRINLGKGGIGYSVGGRGFRTGVTSSGRKYSTFSIPGSGLSYHKSHGNGCLWLFALPILFAAAAVSLV